MVTDQLLHDCINWARENGAQINNIVDFRILPDGIGAYVTDTYIDLDKPLISIPYKLLITQEISKKYFNNIEINCSNPNALTQLFIAKLKFGKDLTDEVSRFFSPYITILPDKSHICSPYFWNLDELELLKGCDIYLKIKRNLLLLFKEWHTVLTDLNMLNTEGERLYEDIYRKQDFEGLINVCNKTLTDWKSFSAYLWSYVIFTSRAFPAIILDQNKDLNTNEAFLYPIVDFLNHKNNTSVLWKYCKETHQINFFNKEKLIKEDQLFNNYGNKSNEDLIMEYGFLLENNTFNRTSITLKLDTEIIQNMIDYGIPLNRSDIFQNSINFYLSVCNPLPHELICLFSFLKKLTSETSLTIRSTLEGLSELLIILKQKLDFFKSPLKIDNLRIATTQRLKLVKAYKISEKKLFQNSIDSITQVEKILLKVSPPLSFKTIFKMDKQFSNSLLLSFGVKGYEDIISKNLTQQVLLLWIVRIANFNKYKNLGFKVPEFIFDEFQKVASTIVVEKNDVMEYMNFYKSLFPKLSNEIPEVYNQGDWGIKQFIIADTVIDRLVWIKRQNREPLFLKKNCFNTSILLNSK